METPQELKVLQQLNIQSMNHEGVGSEDDENLEQSRFLDSTTVERNHGPTFGKRHQQVLCNFFLMFIAHSMRVSLSVAIVAMTDSTVSSNENIPTYKWHDKSVVLSAFFWGYIFPQVAAGWFATHYGPKWFLVVAMTVCSVVGFFVPISAAYFGSKGVMFCRAVQGFCQGFIYPSVHALFAKWAPPNERSWLANLLYAGGPCGTVVSMLLTGYISSTSFGWPMVFYLLSGLGIMWCIVFSYLGCDSPAQHLSITVEESSYIQKSIGYKKTEDAIATPWLQILTSTPFWALILTQSGFIWGYYTLLTEIPTYMSKVMGFDLKSNSILSSLPYVSHWVFGTTFGYVSDLLIKKKCISIQKSRKMMNCIGFLIPALGLIFLGQCGPDDTIVALILLTMIVGVNAACLSGFFINHVDLSPNHAGLLMGICNGMANICSIVAPLLVQILVIDEKDPDQWKWVFYISAALYFVANTIFVTFGSTKVQIWNDESS